MRCNWREGGELEEEKREPAQAKKHTLSSTAVLPHAGQFTGG